MVLRLVRPGPVVVSRANGSFKVAGGSAPEGWSVWGSDGRVVPPPGVYRVSHTGMALQKRTTEGRFVTVEGDLVTIESGEAITADYRNDGDVLMVELIPPPCFVGFVWGGCRGAETRATRPRSVPSPGRAAHRHHTRDVDSMGSGAYLPSRGHLLGGHNRRYERGEARQRNDKVHLPASGVIHRRRPPAAAIHAGRASHPRHTRLAQGVSA